MSEWTIMKTSDCRYIENLMSEICDSDDINEINQLAEKAKAAAVSGFDCNVKPGGVIYDQ